MYPATLALLPDMLDEPIVIVRTDPGGASEATATLAHVRAGEDGRELSGIRRYETTDPADQHPVELAAHRVVIAPPEAQTRLPIWSSATATLHPERRDLAIWLSQAQRTPDAAWVAHLPIALRDALRDRATHHPLTVVMSDRAYLSATLDGPAQDRTGAVAPLSRGLDLPAHPIDAKARRTAQPPLAPMPLAGSGAPSDRRAVITRAAAVIAEALLNAVEAETPKDAADVQSLWAAAVAREHQGRLRKIGPSLFTAPVAVLDDPGSPDGRATLLLASVRIYLARRAPDVWLDYHHVIDLNPRRRIPALELDELLASTRLDASEEDRHALLAAARDGSLPVLEIRAGSDGAFSTRNLIETVPDASPLLPEVPTFRLRAAALALLRLRAATTSDPAVAQLLGLPSAADHAADGPGARSDADDDGADHAAVDEQQAPGRITSPGLRHAPEADQVGEATQAPEALEHGSVETADATAPQAAFDNTHDTETRQDDGEQGQDGSATDQGTKDEAPVTTGSAGGQDGTVLSARHDPPAKDAPAHVEVAALFGNRIRGDEAGEGGEPDRSMADQSGGSPQPEQTGTVPLRARGPHASGDEEGHGADADSQVADPTKLSPNPALSGTDPAQGGEDDNAHAPDQTGATGETRLARLLRYELTETQQHYLRQIADAVAEKLKARRREGRLHRVTPQEEFVKRQPSVEASYEAAYERLRTVRSPKSRARLEHIRTILEDGAPWQRMLIALAISNALETAKADLKRGYMSVDLMVDIEQVARAQALQANLKWLVAPGTLDPGHPAPDPSKARPKAPAPGSPNPGKGGPNG